MKGNFNKVAWHLTLAIFNINSFFPRSSLLAWTIIVISYINWQRSRNYRLKKVFKYQQLDRCCVSSFNPIPRWKTTKHFSSLCLLMFVRHSGYVVTIYNNCKQFTLITRKLEINESEKYPCITEFVTSRRASRSATRSNFRTDGHYRLSRAISRNSSVVWFTPKIGQVTSVLTALRVRASLPRQRR